MRLKDLEREHVLKIVMECKNNITLASKVLGIGKATLYRRLKEYGWVRSEASK